MNRIEDFLEELISEVRGLRADLVLSAPVVSAEIATKDDIVGAIRDLEKAIGGDLGYNLQDIHRDLVSIQDLIAGLPS